MKTKNSLVLFKLFISDTVRIEIIRIVESIQRRKKNDNIRCTKTKRNTESEGSAKRKKDLCMYIGYINKRGTHTVLLVSHVSERERDKARE